MDFRIRNVALLFLALVLVAGLASAQPGVTVKQVGSNGVVTQTNVDFSGSNGGPVPKAPTGGANGTYKYWDVLGTGGTSTNYFSTPPYLTQPPNPQVAVGPDDIFTIVNRTIARYPNPNAGTGGNNAVGVGDPYNNPPSEYIWLDTWLGLTGATALGTLCPSGTSNNFQCVIDNASIRYDQMQGRFVVLFTITDVQAHRSNFILIVSNSAQFVRCSNSQTGCQGGIGSGPLFTSPVIAPVVGGTQTGGQNPANWTAFVIPVNLLYSFRPPSALGNGVVGTSGPVTTGGAAIANGPIAANEPAGVAQAASPVTSGNFVTALFCPGGGPSLPLTSGIGGTARACTNYFPTGARFGLDNDNIILTAPVLDAAFSEAEGTLPTLTGQNLGPYAGTRVVTVAKMIVYNGGALNLSSQPPICDGDTPVDCTAINLSDNVVTGTLTEIPGCTVTPTATVPALGTCEEANLQGIPTVNPIPGIYWEPDNLRGRALASFDSQVSPYGTPAGGVITPIDYLMGRITANQGGDLPGQAGGVGWGGNSYFPGLNKTLPNQSSLILLQPIVFSCPAGVLFVDPVPFCGAPSGGQVADQSFLGPLLWNTSSIGITVNPFTVGQGFSAAAMTSSPQVTPVVPEITNRLFVGDSRSIQVMFREGLLYEARSVRLFDTSENALGTSTVLYDLVRTCATGAPNPTCAYSANGATLLSTPPFLAMETEWTNGQNVTDPADDVPGFGFYAPMFDSPANVVNSGPTSPIAVESWLEKLFVGMTTGGTSNLSATFNVDFPSLWDFRPGDDAYETVEPFIDPYTGTVTNTVPCANILTTTAVVTNGSATVTVSNTAGLGVGMYVTSITLVPATQTGVVGPLTVSNPTTISTLSGSTVTLSNKVAFGSGSTATTATVTITFAKAPVTANATVSSTATAAAPASQPGTAIVTGGGIVTGNNTLVIGTGIPSVVQIGSSVVGRVITGTTAVLNNVGAPACVEAANQCAGVAGGGSALLIVSSLANIGPGMAVGASATATITVSILAGSQTVTVPAATATSGAIFPGDSVTCVTAGCGIPAGDHVGTGNGATTTIQLTGGATATGTVAVVFSTALPGGFVFNTGVNGSANQVILSAPLTVDVPIGRAVTFDSTPMIPGSTTCAANPATCTTVTGLGSTNGVVFLSAIPVFPGVTASTCPTIGPPVAAAGTICTNNIPVTFGAQVINGVLQGTACPMIQWSQRGGASTDPNDGSLWLFGEFAKYRLASIPGAGQWGTSIANYALDFPASDPYDNDNTYFTDVPATNGFFTWIQIAKNLNIAQPSSVVTAGATGITNGGVAACSTNGNPPIQPPPPAGTTTSPGSATLLCAQFNPTAQVTRAEMAYWVVRAQMDEAQVSNFLCATGGDPTGLAPCSVNPGASAFTFGDTTLAVDPFVTDPTKLPSGFTVVTAQMIQRYIEVMARRGYTKGDGVCTAPGTDDAVYRFCPNDLVTREQMAVFLIRAKMNNVFPTSLSGVPTSSPYGDNFKLFLPSTPYFSDVPNSGGTADYYIYVQKMRELRITNGTSGTAFSPTNPLMREEIATFVVRAFFL